MDYSKTELKQLKDLLQKEHSDQLEKETIAFLKTMKDEYLYLAVRNILNKKEDDLKDNIDFGLRASKLFRREMKKGESVEFNMGFFCGVFNAVDYIQGSMKDYRKNLVKLQSLYERDNIKSILLYLYYHPGAQHKTLVEKLKFSASYLSELMGELVEERCVVKYSKSKYSYYELTIDSQNFVKAKIADTESNKLPYEVKYDMRLFEYTKLFRYRDYWVDRQMDTNVMDFSVLKLNQRGIANGKFNKIYWRNESNMPGMGKAHI